ncbi:hypothetical protein PanWU01x14_181040 [Parasponia andersonii]|uniref:Uncharacterized protein n=1 Tax=Parasponia andersonii TaxID=3476 RepID=A0A2P5C638_PARAD|nr:hypothetical protein PanWU01x14_181040 [Parasponia andersonii]
MAGEDGRSRHITDDHWSAKALWAAMDSLEKKLEAKFDDLACNFRQALVPTYLGNTVARNERRPQNREPVRPSVHIGILP